MYKMKKTIVTLVTASAMFVGMTSCKKERMPKEAIKETINVSLKTDESYTFTLPKNLRDDPYEITSQAKHSSISEVGVDASGQRVYSYKPTTGYVGSDQVIVSNDQERQEHKNNSAGPPPPGGPKKGKCHKGKGEEEDHYIITINFVVNGTATTAPNDEQ